MTAITSAFQSALHLFFPHTCTGCGSDLLDEKNMLCLKCINSLQHTNFAKHEGNPVEKAFWGRLHLTAAFSEFYFVKETLVQHLLHQLKYKNNTDMGLYFGELMGKSIEASHQFKDTDLLVPLPLYADKERKRGYNQAAIICEGIKKVLNIPVSYNNVVRQRHTETQTKKHRTERWENVSGSFTVKTPELLAGKNILLVDDVITTGATLEACGNVILQIPDVKLGIATVAFAVN